MKNQTICIVLVLFFTMSSHAGTTFNKAAIGTSPTFSPPHMDMWHGNDFGMGNPFFFNPPHVLDKFKPVMDMDFGKKGFGEWFLEDAQGPFGWTGPFKGHYAPHDGMPGRGWMPFGPKYDGMAGWPNAYGMFGHKYDKGPWDISFDFKAGFSVDTSPGTVPAPGALLLGSIGVALVSWLRRNRTL